jgi:N-carbamoylputrescine amidase
MTKPQEERAERVTVAAIQVPLGGTRAENVARVTAHVRAAAARGAQVILPPELFEGPYFCREEREAYFDWARPAEDNPTLEHFGRLAAELGVVIPVSFFERAGQAYYNSVALLDADGATLGVYRKSHIPDGPGYEEKFYFRGGDTGFRVWKTRFGTLGVGICWDQWFPECARAMALLGADVLFYPTAIGSEPHDPALDTRDPWQRAMIGHAVSNVIPVVASNRIGDESGQVFYGSSFIADPRGDKVAELGRADEGVITASFDLAAIRRTRAAWGFFRDRRPDLYGVLATADGKHRVG